ncbi:MAG: hypothetical protein NVSMB32_09800 [Actinomycetota bacterium]
MSGIRSRCTVSIARTPMDVWQFVIEPGNEKLWHTDVTVGEVLSERPLAVGSQVRWVMNFAVPRPVTLSVVRFVAAQVQEVRADHAVMGLRPTLVYELEPEGDATLFARTIEMNPVGLMRAMTPVMRRNVIKSNQQFVSNLKEHLEAAS